MKQPSAISIVVPTLNEVGNLLRLFERIDATLKPSAIPYEIILVDDHSKDGTLETAFQLAKSYPAVVKTKAGKRGKAYSLLEGFQAAQYPIVSMIDADLQYAPEELLPMYRLIEDTDADVVVTRRVEKNSSALRKLSTKVYNLFFARILFGITFDTQSGLKMFKKKVLNGMELSPSPWSFDLEFLVRALENKFKIISHTIEFVDRTSGETKVHMVSATAEMIQASVKLRWNSSYRKLYVGHRNNSRFLKNAFPMAMLLFVAAFALHPTANVSALPIITPVVTPVVETAQKVIPAPASSSTTAEPTQTQTATPSVQDMPLDPIQLPVPNGSTAPVPQQPPVAGSSQPASSTGNSSSINNTSSYQAVRTVSNTSGVRTASIAVPQNYAGSELTPARDVFGNVTGQNFANAYTKSKPLSEQATNLADAFTRIALGIGIACVVVFIALASRKQFAYQHYRSLARR